MAAPPSQTFRQIGFLLSGVPGGDAQFNFGVRPEDLTISEPSRLTVQQTLGGAWADAFDIGVRTITLAGTTGWRGGILLSGEDLFLTLKATCFDGWHEGRRDLIAQGQDPAAVKLYFTDSLDSVAYTVAPRSFALHRSKTSPLLMRYQIQLLVLGPSDAPDDLIDDIINALSNPLRWLAAKLGLTKIVAQVDRYVQLGKAVFGAAAAAKSTFVNIGVQLLGSIASIAGEVEGVFDPQQSLLLNIAISYSRAAATAFAVLADDATLRQQDRLPISGLASAFNDAACSMANGFDVIGTFPSYIAVRGASTCSSTGGGDASSVFTDQDVSAFAYMFPSTPSLVTVTEDARLAMLSLEGDPLPMVGPAPIVLDLVRRVGSGVVLT